jgi:hypothetical protein
VVFRAFIEKVALVTGYAFAEEGLVEHVAANPRRPVILKLSGEVVTLETRWNLHPIPTNSFKIGHGGQTCAVSNL